MLRKQLIDLPLQSPPDNEGMFGYTDNPKAFVEIVPLSKLLRTPGRGIRPSLRALASMADTYILARALTRSLTPCPLACGGGVRRIDTEGEWPCRCAGEAISSNAGRSR